MAITRLVLPRPWTVLCRLIVTFLIMPSQPTALHSLDSSLPRLGFEGGGNWWQLRLASAEEARGCSTLSSNLPSCPLRGCQPPHPPPSPYGLRLIPIQGCPRCDAIGKQLYAPWVEQHSIDGIVVTKNHDNFQIPSPSIKPAYV